MVKKRIKMLQSTRREIKKTTILALVKYRLTNTEVLKGSSTQLGRK